MRFCRYQKRTPSQGITLIEILLSVAILSMIASAGISVLADFRSRKMLDASTETVFSAFSRAYLDTMGSKSDKQYGVHLATSSVVVFDGDTYSASASTNILYPLDASVELTDVSLGGGTTDVVFSRVYGTTTSSGTFKVRSIRNQNLFNIITVHSSGVISM